MSTHYGTSTARTDDRERMARAILSYLADHRDAQDTLEGIAEWWILEQQIRRQMAEVRQVLADLTARGLLVERRGADARPHYRINR